MRLKKAHIEQLFSLGIVPDGDLITQMIRQLTVIQINFTDSDNNNHKHLDDLKQRLADLKLLIEKMKPDDELELKDLRTHMIDVKRLLGGFLETHNTGFLPSYYVALCLLDILSVDTTKLVKQKEIPGPTSIMPTSSALLTTQNKVYNTLVTAMNEIGLTTQPEKGWTEWHRCDSQYHPAKHDVIGLTGLGVTFSTLQYLLTQAAMRNVFRNSDKDFLRDLIFNAKFYRNALLINWKQYDVTSYQYDDTYADYNEIIRTIDEYHGSFITNCKHLQLLSESLDNRNGKSYRECVQEWDQQLKDKISSQVIISTDRFGTSSVADKDSETSTLDAGMQF